VTGIYPGAAECVGYLISLDPEKEHQYLLDSNELKELIGEIVNRSGWIYRQVYRKKTLAGA
jgi:hypothetical protein